MSVVIKYLADHPEFIPQIATWYFNAWGHHESDNSMEKIAARLNTKLNRARVPIPIVAIVDGKLLGTAQLKAHEMEIYPDREFWLGGVYVDESARNQRIAQQLTHRIEEIARHLGIHELFLQTARLDGGLYAKSGWIPMEQVKYHSVQVLVMHKVLSIL